MTKQPMITWTSKTHCCDTEGNIYAICPKCKKLVPCPGNRLKFESVDGGPVLEPVGLPELVACRECNAKETQMSAEAIQKAIDLIEQILGRTRLWMVRGEGQTLYISRQEIPADACIPERGDTHIPCSYVAEDSSKPCETRADYEFKTWGCAERAFRACDEHSAEFMKVIDGAVELDSKRTHGPDGTCGEDCPCRQE